MAETKKICGLSADDIAKLKQESGFKNLKYVVVKDKDGNDQEYLFTPQVSRTVMDLSVQDIENSLTESVAVQMRSCCVAGNSELFDTDNFVFNALMKDWRKITAPPTAKIKEV